MKSRELESFTTFGDLLRYLRQRVIVAGTTGTAASRYWSERALRTSDAAC